MGSETEDNLEICRLCMSEGDVFFYNIFNDHSVVDSIVSKIWDCIGLKVFLGDGLPSVICHKCFFNLKRLDRFKKMCHRSNAHLVKYYNPGSQSVYEDTEVVNDTTNAENALSSGIGYIVEGSERTVQTNPNVGDVQEISDEMCEAGAEDTMPRTNLSYINNDGEGDNLNTSNASSTDSMILVKKNCLTRKNGYEQNPENNAESIHHNQGEENLPPPAITESHQLLISSSGSLQIPQLVKINSGMLIFPKNIPVLQIRTEGKSIHGNPFLPASQTQPLQKVYRSNIKETSDNKNDLKKLKTLKMEGKYVKVPSNLVLQLSTTTENKPEKSTEILQTEVNLNDTPTEIPDVSESEIQVGEMPERTNVEEHVCDICDKAMPSKANLFQHLKSHATSSNFTYDCPSCDEKFISVVKMEKHLAVHYNGDRPFQCNICDKKFSHSWQVLRHENVHSDVSRFTCEICKRKFTSEAYLNKHMKIHNKSYICDICNRAFSFDFQLNKHKSKFHEVDEFVNNAITEDDNDIIYISDDDTERITETNNSDNISEIENSSSNPEVNQISKLNGGKRAFENQGLIENGIHKRECKDIIKNVYPSNTLKLFTELKNNTQQFTSNEDEININNGEISEMGETSEASESVSSRENMYTCSKCLHIYDNIDDLMVHEQTAHNINKIYTCIGCMKMFTRQSYLIVHSKDCEGDM